MARRQWLFWPTILRHFLQRVNESCDSVSHVRLNAATKKKVLSSEFCNKPLFIDASGKNHQKFLAIIFVFVLVAILQCCKILQVHFCAFGRGTNFPVDGRFEPPCCVKTATKRASLTRVTLSLPLKGQRKQGAPRPRVSS